MFPSNSQIRIAVLRGGSCHGYECSLKSGEYVLSHLRSNPEKYLPQDIFISKDGAWHLGGLKQEPHKALRNTDLVFNTLHSTTGESGHVQRILDSLRIPY